MKNKWGIGIHGGAGDDKITSIQNKIINISLEKGIELLKKNESADKVCEICISILEDSGYFNCGKGSVTNKDDYVQNDAGIMISNKKSGSVISSKKIKNPIQVARNIMNNESFKILSGDDSDNYAKLNNFNLVTNKYFKYGKHIHKNHYGTVGCVVLDKQGILCSGTSTGGIFNKISGRVGDSPIIGAGTFANSKCAISCTGIGEDFIKHVISHSISERMKYKKISLKESIIDIFDEFNDITGGVIGIDNKGNITVFFNTKNMIYQYKNSD